MLERIREGVQGPWAMIIVALIVLSFVFTGVGSYLGGSASTAAALVNESEISESELDTAYQNERARIEAQFGEAAAGLFADEASLAEFKSNVLERLIADKLIQEKAKELGLRVSDQAIKDAIIAMPEFQLMGQFDNATYQSVLRRAGFQPADFSEYMRNQMISEQLRTALTGSAFGLDNEVKRVLQLQQQTRDASILQIESAAFAEGIEVSDAEILAYYDVNLDKFDTQEQVKLAYVSLSVDELMQNETVSDEEVATYYAQNQANYETVEQRRISHILIEFGDDEAAAEDEIKEVLNSIQNAPDEFASIAEQRSQDIVSAEEGGDLGFIERGLMGDSFDDAAFSLSAVNEISDIVRTEFGFHILKLTDLTPSVVTELAEVAEQISTELLREKALDTFFGLQEQMATLAFEVPETLEDVANAISRPIVETGFFTDGQYPAEVNYAEVRAIAFSDDLVEEQLNSDLLEVSDETVMVVRVAEHKPQRTLQLDEVKEGIVAQLKQDKAQQAAIAWAESVEAALLDGSDAQSLLTEQALAWQTKTSVVRNSPELASEMSKALFELSPSGTQSTAIVPLLDGNVGLVKLEKVNQVEEIAAEQIESYKQRYAMTQSRKTFDNFIQALRAEAEVVVY